MQAYSFQARSTARGLRIAIPCRGFATQETFCQLNVVTSSFVQGQIHCEAADVGIAQGHPLRSDG